MKKSLCILGLSIITSGLWAQPYTAASLPNEKPDAAQQQKAASWQAGNMSAFVENKGQIKDQEGRTNNTVKYLLSMRGLSVQLRANSFSYDTWITDKEREKTGNPLGTLRQTTNPAPAKMQFHRVDITLEGANPSPQIVAEQSLPGTDNVMDGPDVYSGIHRFRKITYKSIYPGIDLEFLAQRGTDKPVEYNFIVHPGGDPDQIRMHYSGANDIALKDGMIRMTLNRGELVEKIPSSFIEQTGERVAVQYQANDNVQGMYAFRVPDYDHSKTLVIDPTPTLMWATYLGGTEGGQDGISAVQVDKLGNVIVVGTTDATTSIATIGTPVTGNTGTYNNGFIKAYAVKYTAAGVKTWGVMIGGNANDFADAVTTDTANNIYVGMFSSSTTLKTSAGVHQTVNNGLNDVYVVKLTSAGAYVWGTYLGSADQEEIYGICVAADGNILLGGFTDAGGAKIGFGGGYDLTFGGARDGFIAKLNSTTGAGMWGTLMGGAGNDWVLGLTNDTAGNVYFTGATSSTGLATAGAVQTTFGGGIYDFFIGKLNSTGSALSWRTYYGGSDDDAGFETVIDHTGNLVVSGRFQSTGLATAGAYQTTNGGGHDAMILKMTPAGALLWATYYGGPGEEQAHAMGVDESNNIYVYGYTSSTSGIATNCSFQPTFGGGAFDCYVGKISSDGTTRLWGSYFGGSDTDQNNAQNSNAGDNFVYAGDSVFYIAGITQSAGLATGGAADVSRTGAMDGFVAKMNEGFAPQDVQVTAQTLSPLSQTACALGIPSVITGNIISIYNPATFTSPVFYQWQVADDSTAGPWTDLPGEVFKDLTPLSGNTTKYYRRQVLVNNGFCDKKIVNTSPVATVTVTANVAPTANADGPQWFLCGSPNTITLNGSAITAGGATISSYQWYAGSNLTTPVAATATYTPANITASTTYTLKVTDNNGCTDVDQVTVTPAIANAGPDQSLCQGSGGVQIGTTGVAGGSVTYNWTIVTGGTTGSLSCTSCSQPVATPTALSKYALAVTVTRKDGTTCITRDTAIISFVATPTNGPAIAGTDKTICKSSTVVLGNGTPDASATYSWAPANYLSNSNIGNPTFNAGIAMVSCPLTYTVTAVKNGCTFTDQVNVSVINPQVDYENDTFGCYLFSEQLNEPNCGNAAYAWQVITGPGVVQSTSAGGSAATLYNPGASLTSLEE